MRTRKKDGFSRRERQIMDIVYSLREATAADVHERLADAPTYTAVRGLLRVLVDQGQRRPGRELAVGLVDHEQAGYRRQQDPHGGLGFDQTRRVVGRAQERDRGVRLGQDARRGAEVEREVGLPLGLDDGRPGQACDVRVQLRP